jgi:hypothetical protein
MTIHKIRQRRWKLIHLQIAAPAAARGRRLRKHLPTSVLGGVRDESRSVLLYALAGRISGRAGRIGATEFGGPIK